MSKRKLDEVFAVEAELCEELGSGSESSCSTDRSDQDGSKRCNTGGGSYLTIGGSGGGVGAGGGGGGGSSKSRRRKSKTSGSEEEQGTAGGLPGAGGVCCGGSGGGGGGSSPSGSSGGRAHPRTAANARERDRTHSVNSAFTVLRDKIPTEPRNRKLSKIETLRLAASYISHLATVLRVGNEETDQPCMHMAMVSRQAHEDMPRIICTFCLSHVRAASASAKTAPMRSGQRHTAINPMNDMNGMVHHHPHMHPSHHHHHHHQQTAAMMR